MEFMKPYVYLSKQRPLPTDPSKTVFEVHVVVFAPVDRELKNQPTFIKQEDETDPDYSGKKKSRYQIEFKKSTKTPPGVYNTFIFEETVKLSDLGGTNLTERVFVIVKDPDGHISHDGSSVKHYPEAD